MDKNFSQFIGTESKVELLPGSILRKFSCQSTKFREGVQRTSAIPYSNNSVSSGLVNSTTCPLPHRPLPPPHPRPTHTSFPDSLGEMFYFLCGSSQSGPSGSRESHCRLQENSSWAWTMIVNFGCSLASPEDTYRTKACWGFSSEQ